MPNLDIKITTTADQRGVDATVQGLGKIDASARQAGAGTSALNQATRASAKDLQGMALAGAGVNQAMSGLAQGGISGAIAAVRGLSLAIKGLATSGLGLLAVPLAAAAAAFYAIGRAAENARDRMFGTGERTKAAAQSMKELGQASAAHIRQAAADAEKLAAAYARVTSAIDSALSRFTAVESARAEAEQSAIELERQTALARATTPEERAAINARYDDAAAGGQRGSSGKLLDNQFFAASQSMTEAMTQRRQAQSALDSAAGRVASAREAEAKARASGDVNAFGNALRAREEAERQQAADQAKYGPQLEQANKAYDDSDARLKVLGYKETAFKNTEKASALGAINARSPSAATHESLPVLDSRLSELQTAMKSVTPGDFGTENALAAEFSKVSGARDAAYKAVSDFAEDERKSSAELQRTLRNNAESRAGM